MGLLRVPYGADRNNGKYFIRYYCETCEKTVVQCFVNHVIRTQYMFHCTYLESSSSTASLSSYFSNCCACLKSFIRSSRVRIVDLDRTPKEKTDASLE